MFHYVYEITNNINGKKYIGKRSCKCSIEDDKYMGSGKLLNLAKKKYGIDNFSKKILKVCSNEDDATNVNFMKYQKLMPILILCIIIYLLEEKVELRG